jgi:hypothetical protein
MLRKTAFTTTSLGVFVTSLLFTGQVVNSSPDSRILSNATPIPALTAPASGLEQEIGQPAAAQGVGAASQPRNPSAIAVAQAATPPAPTAILSAFARSIPNGRSSTLMWGSANAAFCRGTGFPASGVSGSLTVSPTVTTTYGITCNGAGGSANQSVTVTVTPAPKLAVGMTVQTTGSVPMHNSPSTNAAIVGVVAPGSKGTIIGGPASADGQTWWEVSTKDGLARWVAQDGLMQASQAAPTVTLSASPTSIPRGQSSTLSWTSANATACSGTGNGFSPSGPSGSLVVSPGVATSYGITCTGAGGSASQTVTVAVTAAPTLAIGMTVAATGTAYANPTPSTSSAAIGSEALGNQGVVIAGPVSGNSLTWWKVAYDDDLTGWTVQGSLAAASPTEPTLSFSANPVSIATGASSTLSWSSSNATSCTGVGFSPTGANGSLSVSPTVSTTYGITCTGSGGSTVRSTPVIVNPMPSISWVQSLPVAFNNPAIVPLGGTETRALVFMDGSLYAAIGDWEDPQLENPQTPGAQVLRLDSPSGGWVEDQDFNQLIPGQTNKNYQAIDILAAAHFDRDYANHAISPVDVLMAGTWSNGAGMTIFEKTVATGSVGGGGTWTKVFLEAPPNLNGQVRSFTSYTDSVTNQELAFVGSDPYGIFSGAYNSAAGGIVWGANAEAGSATLPSQTKTGAPYRVMSFAACGGKLYATIYTTVWVRTDGPSPSWQQFNAYKGPALPPDASGFRGLTCVLNLNGSGSMLIAGIENNSPDIWEFPLDGSAPTIELHGSNYLGTQLGTEVGYGIASYNNMAVYPNSGSAACPDLLIGLLFNTPNYPNAYQGLGLIYPYATFMIRHCNGTYDFGGSIVDPSLSPSPPLIATRTMVATHFPGDAPGAIYAGGYDAHYTAAHNTDWIYRGTLGSGGN